MLIVEEAVLSPLNMGYRFRRSEGLVLFPECFIALHKSPNMYSLNVKAWLHPPISIAKKNNYKRELGFSPCFATLIT